MRTTLVPRTQMAARQIRALDPGGIDQDPIDPPWPMPDTTPPGRYPTYNAIPVMLRQARADRLSGQGAAAMELLGRIVMLAEEYVLSDRICACGGYIDRDNICWNCIERSEMLARLRETAATAWPNGED